MFLVGPSKKNKTSLVSQYGNMVKRKLKQKILTPGGAELVAPPWPSASFLTQPSPAFAVNLLSPCLHKKEWRLNNVQKKTDSFKLADTITEGDSVRTLDPQSMVAQKLVKHSWQLNKTLWHEVEGEIIFESNIIPHMVQKLVKDSSQPNKELWHEVEGEIIFESNIIPHMVQKLVKDSSQPNKELWHEVEGEIIFESNIIPHMVQGWDLEPIILNERKSRQLLELDISDSWSFQLMGYALRMWTGPFQLCAVSKIIVE
jgi:hypothetical protein